jgi:hypothetical protein
VADVTLTSTRSKTIGVLGTKEVVVRSFFDGTRHWQFTVTR